MSTECWEETGENQNQHGQRSRERFKYIKGWNIKSVKRLHTYIIVLMLHENIRILKYNVISICENRHKNGEKHIKILPESWYLGIFIVGL